MGVGLLLYFIGIFLMLNKEGKSEYAKVELKEQLIGVPTFSIYFLAIIFLPDLFQLSKLPGGHDTELWRSIYKDINHCFAVLAGIVLVALFSYHFIQNTNCYACIF
jgi:hypothetical protein